MELKNYLREPYNTLNYYRQENKNILKELLIYSAFTVGFLIFFKLSLSYLDNKKASLILIFLYLFIKVVLDKFLVQKGSKLTKGASYGGLGVAMLIGIYFNQIENIAINYYVATMCFIEFLDNSFEYLEQFKKSKKTNPNHYNPIDERSDKVIN